MLVSSEYNFNLRELKGYKQLLKTCLIMEKKDSEKQSKIPL